MVRSAVLKDAERRIAELITPLKEQHYEELETLLRSFRLPMGVAEFPLHEWPFPLWKLSAFDYLRPLPRSKGERTPTSKTPYS